MKVLVTGGAGFIGSHLCDRLLELGHSVLCVDNLSTGKKSNLDKAFSYGRLMEFKEVDVNCFESLEDIFGSYSPEVIYHYAAVVGVKRTIERSFAVLEDIEGIKNILNLSLKYKVKKVIYSSSSEVYGEALDIPTHEESNVNPGLTYAAVKLIGERYCRSYFDSHNLDVCCLRLFNVYGPRQDSSEYGFVVAIMIKRALENQDIIIYGDGSQTRDFTYISDVVNSSIKVLNKKDTRGELINIGTAEKTSIQSLAQLVTSITKSNSKIKYLPERTNDILNRCAKIDKLQSILGYRPKYGLKEGLEEILRAKS
ncbi:MAG: NAD-dependent epimerase/dehydratase family protein [Candidatus Omnitrophica bacterium]|nr:NAD-dependent epimerase/dehydratase family protein [Candidatus Omnitrophota bacterium]MCF7878904.1 NAD-dependent epimerase/dehydratase family protein [Candidatus Omnitrophota bacterium]MCF7891822.1 NAD-dependent epimerase/dehydratase family protein [Candidatus Omnitrophota bacterium]MCF7895580.1 NAD-dependent epimerase/dehydratase family protein [Candidatus Omnitrophota bacterium]MCF7897200.1 NAD-dependent epimerase/dehydratase family protein [Candidatus Omnitrophota bacterium]